MELTENVNAPAIASTLRTQHLSLAHLGSTLPPIANATYRGFGVQVEGERTSDSLATVSVEPSAGPTWKVRLTRPSRISSPLASRADVMRRRCTNVPFLLSRSSSVASPPDTRIRAW